jgi:alanine racemase
MIRPAWAEIDLGAIRHNAREIRRIVGPKPKIMAVVKAEAYGHGAVPVARAAVEAGVEWLGVSLPEEGIALREAGLDTPILIFSPLQIGQVGPVLAYDLTPTVCQREAAQALSDAAAGGGRHVGVHLKVDTGMGRVGIDPVETLAFAAWLNTLPGLRLGGVYSHMAKADETDKTHAMEQIHAFRRICATLLGAGIDPGLCHLANSAAIIDLPQAHFDLVRAGIMLYGLRPSVEVNLEGVDLRPALSLVTQVVFFKRVPAGTGISYGQIYNTGAPANIATIPVGYADGWSRRLNGKAEALIGGRRYPIVGRICMDQCMVNLGDDEAKVGDKAVLIGHQGQGEITADEVAAKLDTINYEIICAISDRVPRVFIDESGARTETMIKETMMIRGGF